MKGKNTENKHWSSRLDSRRLFPLKYINILSRAHSIQQDAPVHQYNLLIYDPSDIKAVTF